MAKWIWLAMFGVARLGAHHSFAAEFDTSKPVKIAGVVARIYYANPHIFLWVRVGNEAGKATEWKIESGSPNGVARLGWTKNSLKAGDPVTVEGFAAKDEEHFAQSSVVVLPGGLRVRTGVER